MRLSATLNIQKIDGRQFVCCESCDHSLVPAGQAWKPSALLRERPVNELGGVHLANPDVRIREFSCPSCGHLLDTETAMNGDPFLNDIIYPRD